MPFYTCLTPMSVCPYVGGGCRILLLNVTYAHSLVSMLYQSYVSYFHFIMLYLYKICNHTYISSCIAAFSISVNKDLLVVYS